MYPLDPYRPRGSALHTLDARVKLVLTMAFIVATALTPAGAWPIYILLLAAVLSAAVLSELGPGYVLRRSALALPFVLAALPLLLTTPGQPFQGASRPLAVFRLGPWTVAPTAAGAERLASIAARSWISVQAAILLAATTPFQELLLAMRALRLPRLLVAVIGLMWRYLFVLADEAGRLLRARAARSGVAGRTGGRVGGSIGWRARVAGGMAGSLFLRSLERADRTYAAMAARGYDGEARGLPGRPISQRGRLLLGGGLVSLALLAVAGNLLWG